MIETVMGIDHRSEADTIQLLCGLEASALVWRASSETDTWSFANVSMSIELNLLHRDHIGQATSRGI
ncbi:hypothetical protein CPY51_28125 [Rhizobium tubonense]|uniref:Uncharacterized protein n=1 Tax=Rhizobium tubonense TaxID=484088 RepID=A0A2W4CTV8_9HYPH|nr:hypothetical protein CPY51_28125 [Rhizobium tubonense]